MPYYDPDRKKWRAAPKYKGRRLPTRLFKTKREAIVYEIEAKERARTEDEEPERAKIPDDTDLMTFLNDYLDFAARYSPKTYGEKKGVCKRLIREWGPDLPISAITTDMAQKYIDRQAQARSANAANKDRKNLLAAWNKAIKFGRVSQNPWGVTERWAHDETPQYTPPPQDVLKLLAAASPKDKVFLDAYLQTGARRAEIFRWRWTEDINFERRMYRLGTKKNKDGQMQYSWFPMNDDLYEGLLWWRKHRTIRESPYVFVDDQPGPHYGKPYKERRRFMAGLCKRAGITPFGFHALRRFVASMLLDQGQSTKTIQRMLRHANVATTERYLHSVNSDMRQVAAGLTQRGLLESIKRHNGG